MSSATIATELRTAQDIHGELAAIVGRKFVLGLRAEPPKGRKKQRQAKQEQKPIDQGDFAIDDVAPSAIVSPASEEEIAAILKLATENDYVIVPAGGLTKRAIGSVPERVDILLRTDRLNKVLHYDAGDLTLGVGAGMTIAEVQKALASNSQFLPLDPAGVSRATIGGVLASNANGPMRSGFGSVRDYCIGIHFVTGDGKIAKGGGKVVKNVAGYDLMKLMIGSFGTLGVITSANFKVFPLPQQACTYVCECATAVEAIALRDRVIASPLSPMCLELMSPRAQEYLAETAPVRDPDHYAPSPSRGMKHDASWQLVLRASGSDAVLGRYRAELGGAITREVKSSDEQQFWERVSDFEEAVASRHRNAMVVRVNVEINAVRQAYEAAEQSAVEHNLLCACIGRAAVGSLLFAFMPLGVDPPAAMQFANVASSLRGRLPKGSSAIVLRCPRESKLHFDIWGDEGNDLEVMRGVRAAMDPKQILNRGRFIV